MKKSKLLVIVMLIMVLSLSFVFSACGKKKPPVDEPDPIGEKQAFFESAVDRTGKYTLMASAGRPITLNPHMSNYSADSDIMQYLQTSLYTRGWDLTTLDGTNPTYKWYNDAAKSAPVDITSSLTSAQKTKYGVPADKTAGYAWEFEIRNDMKWEDGTAINAQTYIDSMELCLNSKYLNFRATEYWSTSKSALANAINYANKGWMHFVSFLRSLDDGTWVSDIDDDYEEGVTKYSSIDNLISNSDPSYSLAFSFTKTTVLLSDYFGFGSIQSFIEDDILASYADEDYDGDGITIGEGDEDDMNTALTTEECDADVTYPFYKSMLAKHNEQGYVKISELTSQEVTELYSFLQGIIRTVDGYYGTKMTDYWCGLMFAGKFLADKDFSDVGIYKTGDYKFAVVLTSANTPFQVKSGIDGWLVKPDLYKAGQITERNLTISKYGSSKATVQSYGPYKLKVYDSTATSIELERNPNWFGWTDPAYANQYMTSDIHLDLDASYDQLKDLFFAGKLDGIGLQQSNYNTYKDSDNLHYIKDMSTWSLFFNSVSANLKAIDAKNDENSQNTIALTSANFRKAISLAINRREILSYEIGASTAFTVLNSLFIYNIENDPNSIYRNQRVSREVIADAYNIPDYKNLSDDDLAEAVNDITGFDKAQATTLFTAAFNELKDVEGFDRTKPVKLQVYIPVNGRALSNYPRLLGENQVIEDCLKAAIAGTGFAGISFKYASGSPNVYDEFRDDGTIEILYGSFIGDNLNPFGYLDCFTGGNLDNTKKWSGTDTTKISIKADFDLNPATADTTVTMTPTQWQDSIEVGDYSEDQTTAGYELRLLIATHLEKWINSTSLVCPLYADGGISLYSKRIIFVTHTQHPVLDFGGGVRWRRYTMTDADWTAWVASNNNNLTDIYK